MAVISVSQLNRYVKTVLERDPHLGSLYIRGEISNFKNHYASGHLYLSLKDEGAVISAVMYRFAAAKLNFRPEDGMKVIVKAKVTLYEKGGSYQLLIDEMQPDGVGALQVAYEQLKAKLAEEGLFDESRKRPIPRYPSRVGVITSETGAAVQDIRNVLGRRYPMAEIVMAPVLVQGDGAAAQITAAVKEFNDRMAADVLIVGRGGGSIEDLWAFNNEALAREVAASRIPIISAVGHETDFTICDFVADLRAPTPSAAAELTVPDVNTLRQRLDHLYQRVIDAGYDRIEGGKSDLKRYAELFGKSGLERYFRFKQECLKGAVAKVESLNPLAVLTRGYAVALKDGKAVTKSSQLDAGDVVEIRLSEGSATAKIQESVK